MSLYFKKIILDSFEGNEMKWWELVEKVAKLEHIGSDIVFDEIAVLIKTGFLVLDGNVLRKG